jgi:hypothetical protein
MARATTPRNVAIFGGTGKTGRHLVEGVRAEGAVTLRRRWRAAACVASGSMRHEDNGAGA